MLLCQSQTLSVIFSVIRIVSSKRRSYKEALCNLGVVEEVVKSVGHLGQRWRAMDKNRREEIDEVWEEFEEVSRPVQ